MQQLDPPQRALSLPGAEPAERPLGQHPQGPRNSPPPRRRPVPDLGDPGTRRPGLPGVLAALTVPLGAAAQMVLLPYGSSLTTTRSETLATALVWTGAFLVTAWILHRHLRERRAAVRTIGTDGG
ncbi:hypothetical protein [Streptomyces lichenis]|uniref:hypothetical protein n=1 Tax=Streptomyces lichenis TaxID=2306967 RepID=UPI003558B0F0